MKEVLKKLIPPILLESLRSIHGVKFSGNFRTWEDAEKHASGYDHPSVFEKVKEAALRVKNGDAVYERDSVIFSKVYYSWPLLASLMWIAAREKGELNLVDFGGSLGCSYFQNRKFLDLVPCRWNVVEQKRFVDFGKKHLETDNLTFYDDLKECLRQTKAKAVLLSSVLPYIQHPYSALETIIDANIEYIIVDRNYFTKKAKHDRLTIQKVPSHIYKASYPCRHFYEESFKEFFSVHAYTLMEEFNAIDGESFSWYTKGFLFVKDYKNIIERIL